MSFIRIASTTERTTHAGVKVTTSTTVGGAKISKLELPSGETVVNFDCQDCGLPYAGMATTSATGIHGLMCPACGFVHADH